MARSHLPSLPRSNPNKYMVIDFRLRKAIGSSNQDSYVNFISSRFLVFSYRLAVEHCVNFAIWISHSGYVSNVQHSIAGIL